MPESVAAHVLVIEDDPAVAEALQLGLGEAGYRVSLAGDGEEGCYRALETPPDILVLDLNLPGRDGLEILAVLRRRLPALRVLIVSARDTVGDRVLGLDSGADDYLVKPYSFAELLARVRALHRREPSADVTALQVADLELDLLARRVWRAGRPVAVTPREFEILEVLARNEGRVVSRQTLAQHIWPAARATPIDNVIDVHIMHLRRKLDHDQPVPLLHTLRGLGFVLGPPPAGDTR